MAGNICRNYKRNMLMGAAICLSIYAGTTLAAVSTYNFANVNNVTVPLFGVPLTVLAMAAAGAMVGSGYTDPVESRKKLYTLTLANTIFAAWFVVLIPAWQGWSILPIALPPLAGVIAAVNCILIPAAFKRLPSFVNKWLDKVSNGNITLTPPPKEGP